MTNRVEYNSNNDTPALIAITGTIAAGATTLSNGLTSIRPWNTVLEADVERENPFFAQYHADQADFAFHNQVAFLTKSAELHRRLRLKGGRTVHVQDFTPFEHTEVYAHVQKDLRMLSDSESEMLQRISSLMEAHFVTPRVLVYRPLTRAELLKRVRNRGRPSEQSLTEEFLLAVRDRFEEWASGWTRSPIIRVDPELDVHNDVPGVEKLATAIEQHL